MSFRVSLTFSVKKFFFFSFSSSAAGKTSTGHFRRALTKDLAVPFSNRDDGQVGEWHLRSPEGTDQTERGERARYSMKKRERRDGCRCMPGPSWPATILPPVSLSTA